MKLFKNYIPKSVVHLIESPRCQAWMTDLRHLNWKRTAKGKRVLLTQGLAAVVTFATVYALILPAITLSEDVFCGLEEHVHDENCYKATEPEDSSTADDSDEDALPDHSGNEDDSENDFVNDDKEGSFDDDTSFNEDADSSNNDDNREEKEEEKLDGDRPDAGFSQGEPENTAELADAGEKGHALKEKTGSADLMPSFLAANSISAPSSISSISSGASAHLKSEDFESSHMKSDSSSTPASSRIRDCSMQEHTHTRQCFSNPEADVETKEDWEKTLPEVMPDHLAERIAAVAESQKDYKASTRNFQVRSDGTEKGWSRYGAVFSDPYCDWNLKFIDFVLSHSGAAPLALGASQSDLDMFIKEHAQDLLSKDSYQPKVSDLVFLHNTADEKVYAGILIDPKENLVLVGDVLQQVKLVKFTSSIANSKADSEAFSYADSSERSAEDGSETAANKESDQVKNAVKSQAEGESKEVDPAELLNGFTLIGFWNLTDSSNDSNSDGNDVSRFAVRVVPVDENDQPIGEAREITEETILDEKVFGEAVTAPRTVEKTGAKYMEEYAFDKALVNDMEVQAASSSWIEKDGVKMDVLADTEIHLVYRPKRSRTEYLFENEEIQVRAVSSEAHVLPDDAEFVVQEVTEDSEGYHYEAYHEAAVASGADPETLKLYDFAFYMRTADQSDLPDQKQLTDEKKEETDGKDSAAGSVKSGSSEKADPAAANERIEVQPEGGTVTFSITRLKTESLDLDDPLHVLHLSVPVFEDQTFTTKDQTDIRKEDIVMDSVEVLQQEKSLEMTVSSLSVFGFSAGTSPVNGNHSTDRFLEQGGSYSLHYLMNNYQVVLHGNANLGHTMGPVLVGGNMKSADFHDDYTAAQNVSSYIKGTANVGGIGGRIDVNGSFLRPVYFGSSNDLSKISHNPRIPIYINDNFLDFDDLFESMRAQADYLNGLEAKELTYRNGQILLKGSGSSDRLQQRTNSQEDQIYSQDGNLYLKPGDQIKMSAEDITRMARDWKNIVYDFTNSADVSCILTITGNPEEGLMLPVMAKMNESGNSFNQINTSEIGKYGFSLLYNIPDAASVQMSPSGQPFAGHILAPNAQIKVPGGNYAGCLIGLGFESNGAEGHMHSFTAPVPETQFRFLPIEIGKTVQGHEPPENENFLFGLYLKDQYGKFLTTSIDVYAAKVDQTGKTYRFDKEIIPKIFTKQEIEDFKTSSIGKTVTRDVMLKEENHAHYLPNPTRYYLRIQLSKEISGTDHVTEVSAIYKLYTDETYQTVSEEPIEFDNSPGNGFVFPETGGTGTTGMNAAGLLLVSGCLWVLRYRFLQQN